MGDEELKLVLLPEGLEVKSGFTTLVSLSTTGEARGEEDKKENEDFRGLVAGLAFSEDEEGEEEGLKRGLTTLTS